MRSQRPSLQRSGCKWSNATDGRTQTAVAKCLHASASPVYSAGGHSKHHIQCQTWPSFLDDFFISVCRTLVAYTPTRYLVALATIQQNMSSWDAFGTMYESHSGGRPDMFLYESLFRVLFSLSSSISSEGATVLRDTKSSHCWHGMMGYTTEPLLRNLLS